MALGMRSHAGGNRPSRCSCPFATGRIVARFRCEGKSDHAWKSRIFNNLEYAGRFFGRARASRRAIVVLVERGGAMIATRPTTAFLPFERIGPKTGSRSPSNVPGDFHDQRQRRAP